MNISPGRKIMLIGFTLILLSIACNSMISNTWETLNGLVGDYGHWAGFVLILLGLFVPDD